MSTSDKTILLRMKFKRTGAPVWLAHLDIMHAFERGLRRAHLDLLYSQGYNPRPQLVFALPLGVGLVATTEIVDAYLNTAPPTEGLLDLLTAALPDGIEITDCRIDDAAIGKHLMADVAAAIYQFDAPGIDQKVAAFAGEETLPVTKFSKGKYRSIDMKPLILGMGTQPDQVTVFVKAGSHENLRPDLILEAAGLDETALEAAMITRTALYLKPHQHLLRDGGTELLDPYSLEPIDTLPDTVSLWPEAKRYLSERLWTKELMA